MFLLCPLLQSKRALLLMKRDWQRGQNRYLSGNKCNGIRKKNRSFQRLHIGLSCTDRIRSVFQSFFISWFRMTTGSTTNPSVREESLYCFRDRAPCLFGAAFYELLKHKPLLQHQIDMILNLDEKMDRVVLLCKVDFCLCSYAKL